LLVQLTNILNQFSLSVEQASDGEEAIKC